MTVFLVTIAFSIPGFAQSATTGDVTGTVQDPSGAVVPNATITLKNDATGEL